MPARASAARRGLMACLLKNEPASYSAWRAEGPPRSSRPSERESEEGAGQGDPDPSRRVDPKPSELPMARLKVQ